MKILLLAPHPFFQDRGTPIAVDHVLRVLSERQDEVDVVTYREGIDVVYPGVKVLRVPHIPLVRNIQPGFSIKKLVSDGMMLVMALRLARRYRYDLLHAVEESVFIALVIKLLFKIPYLYDMDSSLAQQMVEQLPWLRPLTRQFAWFEGLAVRHAWAVVPVCDALADGIKEYKPKKVVTLYDVSLLEEGVEPEEDLRQWLGIEPSAVLFMYVGNLQPYQGIDLLLQGFQLTLAKIETAGANLVVIGGSQADIDKYQKMADALAIAAHVHFVGSRPIQQLSGYLAQADVLVSPRVKGNNTPMKIYSYLHSGKPLLATDLPTHTQVVDHESALLVAPEPIAWSEGMLTLIGNRKLRERLGATGQHLIETRYSYPVFKNRLNGLLDWLAKSLEHHRQEIAYLHKQ
jgi:glycosyltransferase involved in cell wall biosynthesis